MIKRFERLEKKSAVYRSTSFPILLNLNFEPDVICNFSDRSKWSQKILKFNWNSYIHAYISKSLGFSQLFENSW